MPILMKTKIQAFVSQRRDFLYTVPFVKHIVQVFLIIRC